MNCDVSPYREDWYNLVGKMDLFNRVWGGQPGANGKHQEQQTGAETVNIIRHFN